MSIGEERHETCRYGALTKAFRIELDGRETPDVMPLCLWRFTRPCPPAVRRSWGGAIEFDRDCAVCPVYSRLEPTP